MSENRRKWMRDMTNASSVGLVIVISVLIGYGLGRFLDRVFGTDPWLTVVFIFLGAIAGFIEVFRIVKDIGNGE